MSLYRTEAIILRTRPLGEADKILTLLTRDEGKVSAAARGARRPRSRLLGGSQVFTFGRFALFRRQGLHSLSQVEIIESFRPLREDLTRMAYATYLVELVDQLLEEHDPSPDIFALTLAGLHLFAFEPSRTEMESGLRKLELRLTAAAGYRPEVETCQRCRRALAAPSPVWFSPAVGGIVCRDCPAPEPAYPLGGETLAVMREILRVDLGKLRVVKPSDRALQELGTAVTTWVDHCTGEAPKSRAFLDSVRSGAAGGPS